MGAWIGLQLWTAVALKMWGDNFYLSSILTAAACFTVIWLLDGLRRRLTRRHRV